ncbi:hypothetical protein C5167_031129 [Papaver somniferum]|nr:hypothetical protein C5167_031129 [Papaver somniferum]
MAKLSPIFHLFLVVLIIFASGKKTIQADAKTCTIGFDCQNEEYCKEKCGSTYHGEGECVQWDVPIQRQCRCYYHC